jgi:hypothetical protein
MSQMTQGVAAGRPQPQTTVEPPGGPFIRHSQAGRRPMYQNSSVSFGGLVGNPLVAAPGYTRGYRVKITATGGTGTATQATIPDTPGSIASLVQFKDSFGTPLIVGPGYETLQLLQLYGGQFGLGNNANVINLPTSSAISTATQSAGNRLRFLVDGVPLIDTDITSLYDDLAIQMGIGTGFNNNGTTNSNTRPSGTVAISRKESLSQVSQGLFDTGESYLSTNPGTQIEFAAAPWGSVATAPATLNALCGQIVPSGALIQGLPEV